MALSTRAELLRASIEAGLQIPKVRLDSKSGRTIPVYGATWNEWLEVVGDDGQPLQLHLFLRDTFYLSVDPYESGDQGQWCRALVLGSISSERPGSGLMPDVLAALDEEATRRGCHAVRIENFQNKRLYRYVQNQGFSNERDWGWGYKSLFKLLTPLNVSSSELQEAG